MAKAQPVPPPLPMPGSREEAELVAKRRRGRNLAMLAVLLGLAALFYAIAMVKMATPGFQP